MALLAGCTEALVFKYFKTKDDILEAILQKIMQGNDSEILSYLKQPFNFKEFLSKLLNWYVENYIQRKDAYKIIVRHETSNEKYGTYIDIQRVERRVKPITLECSIRQKRGEINKNVDCKVLGALIFELINSMKYKIIFLDLDIVKVHKQYEKMLHLIADSVL